MHHTLVIFQMVILFFISCKGCKLWIKKFDDAAYLSFPNGKEVIAGKHFTVKCTTKCGSNTVFYKNGKQLKDHSDCNNCLNNVLCDNNATDQQIIAILNMTINSSGTFYFQCSSLMFSDSTSWPPYTQIKIFSNVMKLIVKEENKPEELPPFSNSEFMISSSPTPCMCEDMYTDMSFASEMDYMTSYKPVDITTIVITKTMTTQISSVEPTAVTIIKTTTAMISSNECTYTKSVTATLNPSVKDKVVWDNPFKLTQPVTIIIVGSLTILLFISALINGLFVCKIRKKQYHEINRDVTPDNSPRRSSHIPLKKFPESTSSVDSGIVNNTYMDAQEEKEKDREWNKTQNES